MAEGFGPWSTAGHRRARMSLSAAIARADGESEGEFVCGTWSLGVCWPKEDMGPPRFARLEPGGRDVATYQSHW